MGHFQIAGVPERHEPDTGEVNYGYLFDLIDELGYEGWIGCEYIPAAGTSAGLGVVQEMESRRELEVTRRGGASCWMRTACGLLRPHRR